MIYLDYNATTPCDARVLQAMLPYFSEKFGNAASKTHPMGWIADQAVKVARHQVATLIGAEDAEIIFTSGATESCNLAIKGVFENYATKGNHIITCGTEHKAVLDTCEHIEKLGANITYLSVDEAGNIDLEDLENSITDKTILIALMFANNETGTIFPIEKIGAIAQKHQVIFFCDATQALGKLPINVKSQGIGMMAMSAHKIYGTKGVGAIYISRKNPRAKPKPQIDGGGHENGFRSGTLNVPGIVGFGEACTIAQNEMELHNSKLEVLRNQLERGLQSITTLKINGNTAQRLPHVSNVSFIGYKAERLIAKLNTELAFAVGSACTSASQKASHVLQAMHLSTELIDGAIRFSLGRPNTEAEILHSIERIDSALKQYESNIFSP